MGSNEKTKKLSSGFTLVETLITIAIIGILSSMALVAFRQINAEARLAKTRVEVNQLLKAIKLLEADTGQWPGHKTIDDVESGASGNEIWDLSAPEAGLVATDGLFPGWNGPYVPRVPPDPWDNNYFFDTDYDIDPTAGENWVAAVGSFGPNGIGQNVYDSDNIYEILKVE